MKELLLLSLLCVGICFAGHSIANDDLSRSKSIKNQISEKAQRKGDTSIRTDYSKGLSFPTVINLLILSPDGSGSEAFRADLDGYIHINATSFPVGDLPGLNLSDLTPYHVVLIFNDSQWSNAENVGDVLASYIDQGGLLVESLYAMDLFGWQLQGAYFDEGYSAFQQATEEASLVLNLGTLHDPAHPIMTDVDAISVTEATIFSNHEPAPDAVEIADWDNDWLMVAVKDQVVSFNLLPVINGNIRYTDDGTTLYNNAIVWLMQNNQDDPAALPISNWATYLTALLMGSFLFIRIRKIM